MERKSFIYYCRLSAGRSSDFSVAHFSLCVGERLSQSLLFLFRCHINNDDTSRNHMQTLRWASNECARDHEKSRRFGTNFSCKMIHDDDMDVEKKVNGSQSENLFIWWSSGEVQVSDTRLLRSHTLTQRRLERCWLSSSVCAQVQESEKQKKTPSNIWVYSKKNSRVVFAYDDDTQKKRLSFKYVYIFPEHNMTMMMIDMRERWVGVSTFARMYCR